MEILLMFITRMEIYYEIQEIMYWVLTFIGGFYG